MITAPIDSSWIDRTKAVGPAVGLAAWTLVVWVGRVRNVIVDDELAGLDRAWRLALAVAFIVLATVVAAALVRFISLARASSYGVARRCAAALAWFGIVVWPIRALTILLDSYELGFKLVHTVLAVVTVGLGAMVLRWVAATR